MPPPDVKKKTLRLKQATVLGKRQKSTNERDRRQMMVSPARSSSPKKGMTPYINFCQIYREKLKLEHPDWQGNDILKRAQHKWSTMSKVERELFDPSYRGPGKN